MWQKTISCARPLDKFEILEKRRQDSLRPALEAVRPVVEEAFKKDHSLEVATEVLMGYMRLIISSYPYSDAEAEGD